MSCQGAVPAITASRVGRVLLLVVCCWTTLGVATRLTARAGQPGARAAAVTPWESQVTLAWSGVPLRRALGDLAASQHVAVLVDRRIDPGQQIKLELSNEPLRAALEKIAATTGSGVAILGDVAYLGPADRAGQLRTLAMQLDDRLAKLPPARRRVWLVAARLACPELSTPRGLLEKLAADAGVSLHGIEELPHDLWAETETPSLPLVDRLLLVAIQFDRTLEIADDGQSARLIGIAEPVVVERSYPAGRDPQTLLTRWRQAAPEAELRIQGERIFVRARAEDHERMRGGSQAIASSDQAGASEPRERRSTNRPGSKRRPMDALAQTRIDSFAVEAKPLDAVLDTLGKRLQLEIEFDAEAIEAAGINLRRLVSLKLERATVDELLAATLRSAGLVHERTGNKVVVRPAAAAEPTRP